VERLLFEDGSGRTSKKVRNQRSKRPARNSRVPRGPGEFQPDGPTIGFDREPERQKAAALALDVDDSGDLCQHFRARCEPDTIAVGEVEPLVARRTKPPIRSSFRALTAAGSSVHAIGSWVIVGYYRRL
jgi:hypothetical protein